MKTLSILGLGESGVGAARLAVKLGFEVYASDSGVIEPLRKEQLEEIGVQVDEGAHDESRILASDVVVKSPGLSPRIPLLQRVRESGIPIWSEIELASRYTTGKIIAITGTNGKTTTATLTHHILKEAGFDVALVGNVGRSFAGALAECDHDYWVVEVSSFQLEDVHQFRPHIAVLLNITPDHLDRHGSMAAYTAAKFRIAAQQTQDDAFIYISDFEILQKHLETHPLESTLYPISLEQSVPQGAYGLDDTLTFTTHNSTFQMSIFDLALSGKHNAYNSMASGLAAKLLQIRKEVIRESLSNFQHVPHRLESVVSIRGVEYINDSKATNINSTWYALDSMTRPTVWIVGGVDKGNDYEQLKPLVADRVKAIVCLGLDNSKIIDAFHSDIEVIMETDSMATAVKVAYNLAGKGDAVLLSPACASFDLFENFEDRGNQFKHQVHQL